MTLAERVLVTLAAVEQEEIFVTDIARALKEPADTVAKALWRLKKARLVGGRLVPRARVSGHGLRAKIWAITPEGLERAAAVRGR